MNNRLTQALHSARMAFPIFRPRAPERLERQIGDSPQSAETVAAKVKADRLATLDAEAFHWIARGREANLKLGRVFNEIKVILEHGAWEPYFTEKFFPRGIALRTAQLYMKMASEADAISKPADFAFFPTATDPQATQINAAVEEAKQEVARAGAKQPAPAELQPGLIKTRLRVSRPRLDGIYRVPLHLTGQQKELLDALLESENWPAAALEIIATIDRLFVQYGLGNPSETPELLGKEEDNLSGYTAADNDMPPAPQTENTPVIELSEHENSGA